MPGGVPGNVDFSQILNVCKSGLSMFLHAFELLSRNFSLSLSHTHTHIHRFNLDV
jgi:hypothetical protein